MDTRFKKGMIPWNKGKKGVMPIPWNKTTYIKKTCKCGKEFSIRPSWDRVKACSFKCRPSEKLRSSNNPNWKGGITRKHYGVNRTERNRFKQEMQKLIFERDNYTCQLCKTRGGLLQVDHIQSWADYVELRFEMSNCRTLCMDCHYLITYGIIKPMSIKTWGHNLKHTEGKVA